MRGSITKRGAQTYLIRLSLGKDPVTGKRIYRTETVHGPRKEAERVLRQLVSEYETGRLAEPDRISLNEYLSQWLELAAKVRVSLRTWVDYQAMLRRYVSESIGPLPLGRVTTSNVQDLYNSLLESGLSTRSVRYLHSILNQAFKQAVRWRKLSYNPAADVEVPRQQRGKVVRTFTPEQAARFLAAAETTPYGTLFKVALISGMRPGEYFALAWSCVDWENDSVRVERSLIRPSGKPWFFGPPKTPQSRRTIPLPTQVMEELARHRDQQEVLKSPDWDDLDLVFPNNQGRPLDGHNIGQRVFKRVLDRAGLPRTSGFMS